MPDSDNYVFDTGPFIKLREYPRDVFASLWQTIESLVEDGRISSVAEGS